MSSSLAENAIALLIDLAERGEINPWDVKVIDVIDRFLSQLRPTLTPVQGRSPYEANLSESGQAFLYASMLVLLKADSLARLDADPQEEAEENLELLEAFEEVPLPQHLEKRLRRRATAQPPPNRQVTLSELINHLEVMAEALNDPRPRRRSHRPRPQSRHQAVRAITQLAHQENLTETAAALDQFLSLNWSSLQQGEDWLEFDQLLKYWSDPTAHGLTVIEGDREIDDAEMEGDRLHQDRVGVFWALLFLASQSKVELCQDQFYQDLRIRCLTVAQDLPHAQDA